MHLWTVHSSLPFVFYVLLVFAQCLVYNVPCIYGLSICRCPLCSMFCLCLLNVLCIMFHSSMDCPFFVAPCVLCFACLCSMSCVYCFLRLWTVHSSLPLVFYVLLVFAQCLVYNVSCIYGLSILRCPLCSLFCLSLLNVLCILFPASMDFPFFVAPCVLSKA